MNRIKVWVFAESARKERRLLVAFRVSIEILRRRCNSYFRYARIGANEKMVVSAFDDGGNRIEIAREVQFKGGRRLNWPPVAIDLG